MKNYFKYAIGEIILVVIGILIALYIKGWYTEQYENDQIDKVARQVVEDLRTDTAIVNAILRVYEPLERRYKQVLGDSLTLEDFKICGECTALISNMQPFTPNQSGYSILKNFETDLKTHKDSLIHTTKLFYTQAIPVLELLNELIKEDIYDNLREWKNTQDWYANWINGVEDERYYKYMATDSFYKNKVANFYLLLYKNYLVGLKAYGEEAMDLADQWAEMLEDKE